MQNVKINDLIKTHKKWVGNIFWGGILRERNQYMNLIEIQNSRIRNFTHFFSTIIFIETKSLIAN